MSYHPNWIVSRLTLHPRWSLAILAYLTALVIDPATLGSIDTVRRLETTHSYWKGTSAADPSSYPHFAFKGRGGRLYYPYGLGQSLLMLPADVVADRTASMLSQSDLIRQKLRSTLVGFLTFPLVCAATIPLAFGFLGFLGFSHREAVAGALSLLFATTLLHYTQVHQENSLLFLLLVASLYSTLKWSRTGSRRSLIVACCAAGYMLLVRPTTGLDLIAIATMCLCCITVGVSRAERSSRVRSRLIDVGFIGIPCLLLFVSIERWYQWIRFGDLTSTYAHIWATHMINSAPPGTYPPSFPFSHPFWDGFLGQTIRPYKSSFLYDPLMLLSLALTTLNWKSIGREIKVVAIGSFALLMAYIMFYSRWAWWDGAGGWGNRFSTCPAELLALLAVPLLMQSWKRLPRFFRFGAIVLIVISIFIQVESTVLPPLVEYSQRLTEQREIFAIGRRAMNIVAIATGNFDNWGLGNSILDYYHWPRLPAYSPFHIQCSAAVPRVVVKLVWAGWIALLILYALLFTSLIRAALGPEQDFADSGSVETRSEE